MNFGTRDQYDWRFYQLEKKIDLILQHLGIDYRDPNMEAVRTHLNNGHKNEAIKTFRQHNPQVGLKEALAVIESLDQQE